MLDNINVVVISIIIAFTFMFISLSLVLLKDKFHKILTCIFIIVFTFYSAVGLAFFADKDMHLYLIEYCLFVAVFLVCAIISDQLNENASGLFSNDLQNIIDKLPNLLVIMTGIYLFSYIFPFVYPRLELGQIFNVRGLFFNYRTTSFSLRLNRANDSVYQLVTTQIRLLALPFYYMYLYKKRENTFVFMSLFIIPFYLKSVRDFYLSRNEISMILGFIFIYLVLEKKISKKTAIAILLGGIPPLLFAFGKLYYIRKNTLSGLSTFADIICDLFMQEISFVKNYAVCESISSQVNFLDFIIYILTLPIPSSITKLIGFSPPQLAYLLTYEIIGLNFGEQGYYVILPSVLGEGIIVFNQYFAFLYALIFAPIAFWILRKLKSNKHLTYLLVWYILDFTRQLRGGSQYIISSWINILIPFAVIIFLLNSSTRLKNNIVKDRRYSH